MEIHMRKILRRIWFGAPETRLREYFVVKQDPEHSQLRTEMASLVLANI